MRTHELPKTIAVWDRKSPVPSSITATAGGTALERGFRLHEEFQRAFVYKPGFEAWVDSVNASATNLPQNQAADGI